MIICKIGILTVQLVKSNLASRKDYRLKLSTRQILEIFNFQFTKHNLQLEKLFKFVTHKKQLTARKNQFATHHFISIWQNKFATHKITLQLV